jgi:hypothetical protein
MRLKHKFINRVWMNVCYGAAEVPSYYCLISEKVKTRSSVAIDQILNASHLREWCILLTMTISDNRNVEISYSSSFRYRLSVIEFSLSVLNYLFFIKIPLFTETKIIYDNPLDNYWQRRVTCTLTNLCGMNWREWIFVLIILTCASIFDIPVETH